MGRRRKYLIGDVINNRVIKSVDGRFATFECICCKRITMGYPIVFLKRNCICKKKDTGRYSGSVYKNPPEKIKAIKEKYKNGVPAGELERWIEELI